MCFLRMCERKYFGPKAGVVLHGPETYVDWQCCHDDPRARRMCVYGAVSGACGNTGGRVPHGLHCPPLDESLRVVAYDIEAPVFSCE